MNPKRLLKRLEAGSVENVNFRDFLHLVEALGFELRHQRGTHRIYKHPGIYEKLNLQPRGNAAKPYQIRQLMRLVAQYALTLEERDG